MIKGYLNKFGNDASVRVKISHARKVERNGKEYDESLTLYLPEGSADALEAGTYVEVRGDFYLTRTRKGEGDIVLKCDGDVSVTAAPPRDGATTAPKVKTARANPF